MMWYDLFYDCKWNVYCEVKRNLTTAQKEAKILGRLTGDIL